MKVVVVSAEWDDEAKVWTAVGNIQGLVTEAESLERLRERLMLVVPDLLEEFGEADQDISIELIAHSHDHVAAPLRAA